MAHPNLQYFFAHMHLIGILAPALALLAVPGRSVNQQPPAEPVV